MNLKPINNRLLVKIFEAQETKVGGIFIPASAQSQDSAQQAVVVAVGPNVKEIKVNDTVLVQKFGGTEVKIDDKKHLIVVEDEILSVIE